MKWSWKIGKLFGIDVYVHATFFILLVWVGSAYYAQSGTLVGAARGILFIIAVFGTVVLHELGHALTARKFGVKTRDITLLPIGGVARLERMPEKPLHELLVAIAGPAVNVVIAIILFIGLSAAGRSPLFSEPHLADTAPLLIKFFWVNVTLAVFNLIPAFPMDGGRVLRALLALRGDYVRATQTASRLGQGIALIFGVFGLFYSPLLIFVALFVWIGAAAEAGVVQVKAALGGLPVQSAMLTDFKVLESDATLGQAAQQLLAGSQVDFPVVDNDRLVGVLTRTGLIEGLTTRGTSGTVSEVMTQKFETAESNEMLETVFARMQSCECHSFPVLSAGKLVGIVTMDNVGEFLLIQGAVGTSTRGLKTRQIGDTNVVENRPRSPDSATKR